MKKYLSLSIALVGFCFFSISVNSQTGGLIANPTYINPICEDWEYKEGGGTGAPAGFQGPVRYAIFTLACGGNYIAKKTTTELGNGGSTCTISLMNTVDYTLVGDQCDSFEIRAK